MRFFGPSRGRKTLDLETAGFYFSSSRKYRTSLRPSIICGIISQYFPGQFFSKLLPRRLQCRCSQIKKPVSFYFRWFWWWRKVCYALLLVAPCFPVVLCSYRFPEKCPKYVRLYSVEDVAIYAKFPHYAVLPIQAERKINDLLG